MAQAAVPVASAMCFLHERQIIFRDLKPSNIGFDANGVVKLFDFASARQLDYGAAEPQSRPRLLTSRQGTVRYMAPEVYQKQGSDGYSADVWSFAMVLWEILTLQKVYAKATTMPELARMVTATTRKSGHHHHHRPSLQLVALPAVQHLLYQCWMPTFGKRPTFVTIHAILRGQQQQEQQEQQPPNRKNPRIRLPFFSTGSEHDTRKS
mmetsp:Transcript_25354/g.70026  ORF Transcript_25354/g.70026 Transcript_25354/m.70026 type:complete len:208 (+) Transcript_25354:1540-2163(+)